MVSKLDAPVWWIGDIMDGAYGNNYNYEVKFPRGTNLENVVEFEGYPKPRWEHGIVYLGIGVHGRADEDRMTENPDLQMFCNKYELDKEIYFQRASRPVVEGIETADISRFNPIFNRNPGNNSDRCVNPSRRLGHTYEDELAHVVRIMLASIRCVHTDVYVSLEDFCQIVKAWLLKLEFPLGLYRDMQARIIDRIRKSRYASVSDNVKSFNRGGVATRFNRPIRIKKGIHRQVKDSDIRKLTLRIITHPDLKNTQCLSRMDIIDTPGLLDE